MGTKIFKLQFNVETPGGTFRMVREFAAETESQAMREGKDMAAELSSVVVSGTRELPAFTFEKIVEEETSTYITFVCTRKIKGGKRVDLVILSNGTVLTVTPEEIITALVR